MQSNLQDVTVSKPLNKITISNEFPTNPSVNSVVFDTTPTNVPVAEGTLLYSEEDRALEIQIGNDVTLTINEEIPIDVLNKTGSILTNGKLVYIDGAQGNRATASYATNTTCSSASKCIGMVTENIALNQRGKCTIVGRVKGLNTQGIPEGTELYLSTNGDWTTTIPAYGTARVRIGRVLKEHVSDGWIFVYIQQDKYMFGDRDNGNYTGFEDSGFVKFQGNAKPWVDIDFPVIIRNTGTGIPTLATFQGSLRAPQWAINDYYDADDQEMIHQWEEGTNAYWHAHIWTGAQDATNRYVRLQIEFTGANINSAAIANITQNSGDFLIPANTPVRTHLLVPIYTWLPTGFLIGSHIKARLTRIATSNAGTYPAPSANFFCSKFQMHVRCDTNGSRNIGTK
jgi:hypothetical protein